MKRGEKDFQPEGTNLQNEVLTESRQAMYTALQSSGRGHFGKQHATARWYPELRQARVDPPAKGLHFQTIGKSDSNSDVWLEFEEVLYLVERGSLVCYWAGGSNTGNGGDVPMSLQTLYSVIFESASGSKDTRKNEIEMYQVYSFLKRVGFIVRRISSDSQSTSNTTTKPKPGSVKIQRQQSFTEVFNDAFNYLKSLYYSVPSFNELLTGNYHTKLWTFLTNSVKHLCKDVRFGDQIVRNYRSVYKSLDFIPTSKVPSASKANDKSRPFDSFKPFKSQTHNTHKPQTFSQEKVKDPMDSIKPFFNVWKPKENFKKSNPGVADWQVAIFNTLNSKTPTLGQTMSLLNSVPVLGHQCSAACTKRREEFGMLLNNFHEIRCQTNLLKTGHRNIVIATVDSGIINMSSVSDVPFGSETVYF